MRGSVSRQNGERSEVLGSGSGSSSQRNRLAAAADPGSRGRRPLTRYRKLSRKREIAASTGDRNRASGIGSVGEVQQKPLRRWHGMLVMSNVTDPVRVHTMTKGEGKAEVIDLKGLLARDEDFVRAVVEARCRRRSRRR